MKSTFRLHRSLILRVAFCATLISPASYGLDANKTVSDAGISMDEIASQIRQSKQWRILDAKEKKNASGSQYFRFKLLNQKGTVKVINIDPQEPNLRVLD